ncbi:hypothetical protein B0H19DRAFT_1084881 [Mycena capillaripes]|nr:hypothetical protein B0H19DRAFT_1084881 [Mycena capillaripes]
MILCDSGVKHWTTSLPSAQRGKKYTNLESIQQRKGEWNDGKAARVSDWKGINVMDEAGCRTMKMPHRAVNTPWSTRTIKSFSFTALSRGELCKLNTADEKGRGSTKQQRTEGSHKSKRRAFPSELKRILQSPQSAKIGVGILRDASVLWDDLRTEARLLVDAGMMARLLLVEKYQKPGYGNFTLKTSVAEVLQFKSNEDLEESHSSANMTD